MIPLGDENDDGLGGPAVVNLAIIALNILVFIFQSLHPSFTDGFSMIPREIATGQDLITTQYVIGSDDFNARVAKSKFGKMPLFAKADSGFLALQGDHGSVSFRNIKIRAIEAKK